MAETEGRSLTGAARNMAKKVTRLRKLSRMLNFMMMMAVVGVVRFFGDGEIGRLVNDAVVEGLLIME